MVWKKMEEEMNKLRQILINSKRECERYGFTVSDEVETQEAIAEFLKGEEELGDGRDR